MLILVYYKYFIRKKMKNNTKLLILLEIILSIIILILPLDILEFLSLEVVGEPPINGRTWMEGVEELGGDLSMRLLAIVGLTIIVLVVIFILNWKNKELKERNVEKPEIVTFFVITSIFFIVNLIIGYAWWDPNAFLAIGPLYFPSILSLVLLGLSPLILGRVFEFKKDDLAGSTDNMKRIILCMITVAFGYGLISCIWHCCSFFDPKMYYFYAVTKIIQLWALTTFFFKYGFRLFLNVTKPWLSYFIISILFGICFPWHTVGYAITFTIFGLLICYLTRKTDSYIPGLILVYFAYIFHTALPWNGPLITFTVIFPISIGILGVLVFFQIIESR